jgi:hypothetical protein
MGNINFTHVEVIKCTLCVAFLGIQIYIVRQKYLTWFNQSKNRKRKEKTIDNN